MQPSRYKMIGTRGFAQIASCYIKGWPRFHKMASPIAGQPKAATLQIVSDIHLDSYRGVPLPTIERHSDYLALLGDIGQPFDPRYAAFIREQARTFAKVFLVMGNQEYYDIFHSTHRILERARFVASEHENVHLLDRRTFDITKRTRLLGTTLWSTPKHTEEMQRDQEMISVRQKAKALPTPLSPQLYAEWHAGDVQWLKRELKICKEDGMDAVILTHHGPSTLAEEDLCHILAPPTVAVASGHVNANHDITMNGIRLLSNAMGYPYENVGYRKAATLVLA